MSLLPVSTCPSASSPASVHRARRAGSAPVLAAVALLVGALGTAHGQSSAPAASAAPATASPADAPVVVPEVARRELRLPRFPSRDWEAGVFGGVYGTQNFGSSGVGGLRLGYHVTEDVFVEAAYGQTQVSDEAFRQVLPGGVFVNRSETLSYYSLSAGYNVLPGEVFVGRNRALASQVFLIGGVGSTRFVDQKRQTFNLGLGLRVFLSPRVALRVDMRDHLYPLDILGRNESTQNLEFTGGLSVLF